MVVPIIQTPKGYPGRQEVQPLRFQKTRLSKPILMKRYKYIIKGVELWLTDEELEEYQMKYNPGFYNFFQLAVCEFLSFEISNGLQI